MIKRIDEATRHQLINKSRNADVTKSYGTTRYDRKDMQHIYNSVSAFNKIDMNALWKANLLSFFIPVQGEHGNYEVEVLFDGILDAINRELKNNSWTFEYKVVYKAIIDAINKQDIYVSCSCPDWKYRMSYWSSKGRYNSGQPQIVPARFTNPRDSQGAGCKHVMKVLADLDWALKLASCVTNYVTYMEEHYPDKYFDILFPAMYGVSYQRALDQGLIDVPEDDLDAINVDNLDDTEEVPEETPEPQEDNEVEPEDVE